MIRKVNIFLGTNITIKIKTVGGYMIMARK